MRILSKAIINSNYSITKEDILIKYKNMNIFFINCIKSLYGYEDTNIKINSFFPTNIINNNKKNNLSLLDELIDKTGIYIFLDSEKKPVYIGKGGTSKSEAGRDLRYRISQELGMGNTHNTLSNNIIKIESILQNKKISESESIESFIKNFTISTITVNERTTNNKINIECIDKTNALEMILIALFSPKYNL